jgi:serine/threonine protein kinase
VIQQKLGEGGMGVVYEALDTRLRRKVALKFMKPEIVGSDGLKSRFVEEARAAAALDHPNICTIYDVDEASGQLFFSMAFIDGDSLARLIEKGPLEMGRALSIASQIAQGLEAAHEQRIVHRDIKPANVLVNSRGHARITDFGVAHLMTSVTGSHAGRTVVGTPAYMAPEQARGERVDGRADIWSLGVLLFESLSGRLPFEDSRGQRRAAALTTYRPETPAELESIVARALAKRPSDRYDSAGEVVTDLRALLSKLDTVAVPAGDSSPACSPAGDQTEPLPDSNGARPAAVPAI